MNNMYIGIIILLSSPWPPPDPENFLGTVTGISFVQYLIYYYCVIIFREFSGRKCDRLYAIIDDHKKK